MYLRPDEVARVLEKAGFILENVTKRTYCYQRDGHALYINREARMGRTALIVHPRLKQHSLNYAEPTADVKTSEEYLLYPALWAEDRDQHYGIAHGFSSRIALERYLNGVFGHIPAHTAGS